MPSELRREKFYWKFFPLSIPLMLADPLVSSLITNPGEYNPFAMDGWLSWFGSGVEECTHLVLNAAKKKIFPVENYTPDDRNRNLEDLVKGRKITPSTDCTVLEALWGDQKKYVGLSSIVTIGESALMNLCSGYDKLGLVPKDDESIIDFVYRANTTLVLHDHLRQTKHQPSVSIRDYNYDVNISGHKELIREDVLKEASALIPYYMDLSWVAAYVDDSTCEKMGAAGATFTPPNYGFSWVEMLESYKSEEEFMKILAHELVHVGTVFMDDKKDYLETKAYHVGAGPLGEYVTAAGAGNTIATQIMIHVIDGMIPVIPISNFLEKWYPKVVGLYEIRKNTKVFESVQDKLKSHYGDHGNYFLGRLNADEMEEMELTNNIPARIKMKDTLKWKIMKANYAALKSGSWNMIVSA